MNSPYTIPAAVIAAALILCSCIQGCASRYGPEGGWVVDRFTGRAIPFSEARLIK